MTPNQWAEVRRKGIGQAIRKAREDKRYTAEQVADAATQQHGYPLTRDMVINIELGRKKSLDICELLILAKALGVAPLSLLFPDLLDGDVEATPGNTVRSEEALEEFCGIDPDAHTSMQTFWDYHDAIARQRGTQNPDIAYAFEREAQATLQQGRALWGWK